MKNCNITLHFIVLTYITINDTLLNIVSTPLTKHFPLICFYIRGMENFHMVLSINNVILQIHFRYKHSCHFRGATSGQFEMLRFATDMAFKNSQYIFVE